MQQINLVPISDYSVFTDKAVILNARNRPLWIG